MAPQLSESTSFHGRAAEEALLAEWLDGSAGLFLITGPPGAGKTRLARRAAKRFSSRSRRRSLFVDLTSARTAEAAAAELAAHCGLNPGEALRRTDALGLALAARAPLLVVLDNFEHLPAGAIEMLARWRAIAPEVHFLVTSRTELGLGERRLAVGPLAEADAIELFVARAQRNDAGPDTSATQADAAAIARLVSRLDALPLAIELCAARARVVATRELLERPDLRSLDASIDASWALLSQQSRIGLARLSVFHGAFDLAAAEAILGESAIDVLQALEAANLLFVCAGAERQLQLYETVRHYAEQKLERAGERAETEARHARYFSELALTCAREVDGRFPKRALDGLESARANILAAVAALRAEDPGRALETLLALEPLFVRRGPALEFFERLSDESFVAATALDAELAVESERARGDTLRRLGRFDEALAFLERARALAEQACQARLPRALSALARATLLAGDTEKAKTLCEQTLDAARRHGDTLSEVQALRTLSTITHDLDDVMAALQIATLRGHEAEIAAGHWGLGRELREAGRAREAITHLENAHERSRAMGDGYMEALTGASLAAARWFAGDTSGALELYRAAIQSHAESGNLVLSLVARTHRAAMLLTLEPSEEALSELDQVLLKSREWDLPVATIASLFAGFAELACGRRDAARTRISSLSARAPIEAWLRDALDRLLAGLEPNPPTPALAASLERTIGERVIASVTRRISRPAPAPPTLTVAASGDWFSIDGGPHVDLRRREPLKRLLVHLCESHRTRSARAVSIEELVASGWPGDRLSSEAASNRLRNAVATLRRMGLKPILLTQSDGYLLSPEWRVAFNNR